MWEELPGAPLGPIDPTTTDEDRAGVGAGAGASVGGDGGPASGGALEIIRRKVWYSQPPGWMTDEVSVSGFIVMREELTYSMQTIELLARVDAVHERAEAAKKATQSRGNSYVPRRRCERRADDDTVLPNLRGSQSRIHIPRCMVRAEWLASAKGQQFDSGAYISSVVMVEADHEAQGAGAGAGNEGAGNEENGDQYDEAEGGDQ